VIAAIQRQRPLFAPEDGFVYHPMTFGWIVGELLRRVAGSTPGELVDSIARRLDLHLWIGVPSWARPDVAWMEPPLPDGESEQARLFEALVQQHPFVGRSLTMSGAFEFPADDHHVTFNDADLMATQIPAANGVATARSLAQMYAACVSPVEGYRLLTDASLDDALTVRSAGQQLSGAPDDGGRWGTGFQLASAPSQPMLGSGSFGHAGAGGQLGFGDIEHRVGFAYLSNQMGGYGDVRASTLSSALGRCLTD
jgi:CubicO group peptidase (beta-lactamase class C family)